MPVPDTSASPALEEIRKRSDWASDRYAEVSAVRESAADVLVLLRFVDAVLNLHQPGRIVISGSLCKRHENHRFFSITATEADDVRACPDCKATVYNACTGCGPHVSVDACPVRAAITRELSGKEAGNHA